MKVICTKTIVNEQENDYLQWVNASRNFAVEEGDVSGLQLNAEYLVLGIEIETYLEEQKEQGTGIYYHLYSRNKYSKGGYWLMAPASMFNIVDFRFSKFWRQRQIAERIVAFIPDGFDTNYFWDHLTDGQPKEIAVWKEAIQNIEEEFGIKSSQSMPKLLKQGPFNYTKNDYDYYYESDDMD